MPRVKTTERKEPERPAPAVKELGCEHCDQIFTKAYNYKRHLSVKHGVDEYGRPTSKEDYERYKVSARKRERKRELAPATATTAELEDAEQAEQPSAYPTPAPGPEQPIPPGLIRHARQQQSARHRRAIARRSQSAPRTDEPEGATARKATRPSLPSCQRVRAAISAPAPLPRPTNNVPSKRRVEMTPNTLAKKVAHRGSKSSREIAEELASVYAMPSTERRTNENLVRAMRAAQREFCSRLRRALPFNRTQEDIMEFLTRVEEQCQEAERHDSDEFV